MTHGAVMATQSELHHHPAEQTLFTQYHELVETYSAVLRLFYCLQLCSTLILRVTSITSVSIHLPGSTVAILTLERKPIRVLLENTHGT